MNDTTNREIGEEPEWNLRGKSIEELEAFFLEIGEPKYRAKQAFRRINKHFAASLDEFTEFSLPLREKLKEKNALPTLPVVNTSLSRDGTEKIVLQAGKDPRDGSDILIEAVWLVSGKRKTVCISCQSGCSLNCSFCATGTLPFRGNLKAWQIVEQLHALIRHRRELPTNIVFMGMGEPMYNYDEVLKAADIFHDPESTNLSARHITISTAGVVPGIRRLIKENRPYNLAVSFNHPIPGKRAEIMDIELKHPLAELIKSLEEYNRAMKRPITFEYVMIPGVNMGKEEAKELIRMASHLKAKINLIPYNTALQGWRRPTDDEIVDFQELLLRADLPVFNRGSAGKDIDGACGMLALKTGQKS